MRRLDAGTVARIRRMRETMTVAAVARELGLAASTVGGYSRGMGVVRTEREYASLDEELLARASLGEAQLAGRPTRPWDRESAAAALRRFADEANGGECPSAKLYRELAPLLGGCPSPARVMQIFGRWSLACEAAGLTPNTGTRPGHSASFAREDAIAALRRCAEETGRLPSYAGYEDWQRSKRPPGSGKGARGPYPSGAGVRNLVAPRWTDCLRAAFGEG